MTDIFCYAEDCIYHEYSKSEVIGNCRLDTVTILPTNNNKHIHCHSYNQRKELEQ